MKTHAITCLFLTLVSGITLAGTFRSIAVRDLDFAARDGELDTALATETGSWWFSSTEVRMRPEGYLRFEFPENRRQLPQGDGKVVFADDEAAAPSGVISLRPGKDGAPTRDFAFTIDRAKASACDESEFLAARREWAGARADRHLPGTAWFKHLAGKRDANAPAFAASGLDGTFAIFSGGRAVSENLALDRDLLLAGNAGTNPDAVPISDIEGITVKAIDWSARLPEGEVNVDPLAGFIPHDQHALFAPSLPDFLDLIDRVQREAGPVVQSLSSRDAYRGLADRYRRQLGLDVPSAAARLLPAKSVALTGGDPFFATGTDVAFLFETDRPEALFDALAAAIRLSTGLKGAAADNGESLAFVNDDRSRSSHLMRVNQLVVVANSRAQLDRIAAVARGDSPSLGSTDEFRFFRHRYPLGGDEDAFVFLSDAAIRRWCGPETRIGASRRNRALAALNELTSRSISGTGAGDDFAPLLGKVEIQAGRAISERHGSAEFLTPVSELRLDRASVAEKEAYLRWKSGYEQGWARVFDPIAARISLSKNSADLDLTVLPLTIGSEYREIMEFAGDAELPPMARLRPQDSVFHLAMAIDPSSEAFKSLDQQLVPMLPGLRVNPLSWVDSSVSLSFGKSLFWQRIGKDGSTGFDDIANIPMALRIGVRSRLNLGLFLTGVRGAIESSAPDTMRWETRKYGERSYVVVSEKDADSGITGLRIHYAILPKALLLSLDERSLFRAMDREDQKFSEEETAALPASRSLLAVADTGFLAASSPMFFGDNGHSVRATKSWQAIPILNEWHRLFPDEKPAAVHQRLFGTTISCPGGKGYRWNEAALTMESVAYGHPSAPREDGELIGIIPRFPYLQSGIDFEDDGLRLRFRAGPAPSSPAPAPREPGPKLAELADLVTLKPGRVLHYAGRDSAGGHTWSWQVTATEETPRGTRITTSEPWKGPEEFGHFHNTLLLADDGLHQVSWKDEDGSCTFLTPVLDIPADLRSGSVRSSSSRGEHKSTDEDGKPLTEPVLNETEITVLGTETVEVPAGTFENCVKIELYQEGVWGSYFHRTRRHQWYHPGTGLVRSVDLTGVEPTMDLQRIEEPAGE
ncbi:MAG: hypothetical protein KDN05_05500 [Verrucomicrobiae bacterium]|nr:hypothetical protein [Verrucomicrobiae bacterium]